MFPILSRTAARTHSDSSTACLPVHCLDIGPRRGRLRTRFVWAFFAFAIPLSAEEFPVTPYTDPTQLDCPWPKHSHYLQPWRGYIETKSGWDFMNGFGINLQIPEGTEQVAMRLLAETGFRSCRIEVGFGEWNWDETKLNN